MNELTITWSFHEPPVQAKTWHMWQDPPKNTPSNASLEQNLNWPAGTVAALNEAFTLGLGRFTGWDDCQSRADARQTAAHYYKRGVPQRRIFGETPVSITRQGQYPIHVLPLFAHPRDTLMPLRSHFAIIDAEVERAWSLSSLFAQPLVLALNEKTKTLASVAKLCQFAANHNSMGDPWLIIGGGLLADTAAFAATLMQHPFILVPTTLLAMADACVGGKTGVNFPPFGKNQVGAFSFPQAVYVMPQFLKTLPRRHWLGGGAECLKHAFLTGDKNLATDICESLAQHAITTLAPRLATIIQVKSEVVAKDPAEEHLRASLNLGHTLAHALEGVAHANLPEDKIIQHGEAVAYGLLFAALLSHHVVGFPADDLAFVSQNLMHTGVIANWTQLCAATVGAPLDPASLWTRLRSYIAFDKKNQSGADAKQSDWVLLEKLGHVHPGPSQVFTTPVSYAVLEQTWQEFAARLGA